MNGDGSRIATGLIGFDRSVAGLVQGLWIIPRSGRERRVVSISTMISLTEGQFATELSSDGRLVATSTTAMDWPEYASTDPRASLIREVETGRVRFDSGDQKSIYTGDLRFSPDRRRLAAITNTLSFESSLHDRRRRQRGGSSPASLCRACCSSRGSTFNPDSRSLVVASTSGPTAQVRDAETGRLVHSLSLGVSGTDDLVIRRSDGRLLTVSGEDLREWDLPPAKPASLDAGLVLENVGGLAMITNRRFVLAP